MKTLKNFLSITLVLIFGLTQGLSAQSLKKTYKYIRDNEIEKAQLQLNKFTNEVKSSGEDFILYSFAKCLLLCNENTKDYEPYKALEIYEVTSNSGLNQIDINKFLDKYSLSIDIIKEKICLGILYQAKKINTEASYKKALGVKYKCGFESEVDTLWTNVAYNEAKSKNTYKAYVHFYTYHGSSRYTEEVFKKFNEFEYQRAKKSNLLESMNNYIKGHSEKDNPYLQEAIHLRDSIAFSTVNKTYFEYLEFSKNYPNSEYIEDITLVLPELLYSQASGEENIALLELFIKEYPENSRIEYVKSQLENIYIRKLRKSTTISDFVNFRNNFPDSKFIDSCAIYGKMKELASDSVARKRKLVDFLPEDNLHLKGNVKRVVEIMTVPDKELNFGEGFCGGIIYNYDKNGLIKDYMSIRHILSPSSELTKYDTLFFVENIYKLIYSLDYNLLEFKPYSCKVFTTFDKKGNLKDVKISDIVEQEKERSRYYSIDALGNIKEHITGSKFKYKYNINGDLIESVSFINDKINDSTIYVYNNLVQSLKRIVYVKFFAEQLKLSLVEKLDNYGCLIESNGIARLDGQDYNYLYQRRNKFDSNHNLIEAGFLNDDGVYIVASTRKYDNRGNLIYFDFLDIDFKRYKYNIAMQIYDEHFSSDFKLEHEPTKKMFKYVYDKKGNWINMYYYDNNVLSSRVERKIEYYEE